MLGRIFTVGGYTLLSRLTGFARDIMLAAILGAGPVADAFFVALRLPNHFRAIFAEGAFNAAFVPAYAHVHGRSEGAAKIFANRIFTLLFAAQVVLLVVALLFMPQVIAILAPGFSMFDQWEAQMLAMILVRARAGLYSEIPAEDIRRAHVEPVQDVSARLAEELKRVGRDAPIAILPEGPMTIPYLKR